MVVVAVLKPAACNIVGKWLDGSLNWTWRQATQWGRTKEEQAVRGSTIKDQPPTTKTNSRQCTIYSH